MNISDKKRICIDGFNLALSKGTGVATYARVLSYALKEMGNSIDVLYGMNISEKTPEDLREVIFFDSLSEEKPRKRSKFPSPNWFRESARHYLGHSPVEVPISGRVKSRDFDARMPAYDRILNVPALFRSAAGFFRTTGQFLSIKSDNPPDIMHWTYPLPIKMHGAKNIYTIHDLVPLTLPHTTLDDKNYHYKLIKEIVRSGDNICTVSNYAKDEILSFFPGAQSKIFNTYQSFTPSEAHDKRSIDLMREEIKSVFGLDPDNYYLFYGSLEPKKNIGRMIEAFLTSRTEKKLVIVGAMAWKAEGELRFLSKGINENRIMHLEYQPQRILLSLIQNAFALLFPSISEGFGLPVLEALSLGTPVLTSREASLPEVGGDACLYVDAYNAEDITLGIERLERDPELRHALQQKARKQAEKFSMAAYQERLQQMNDLVLASSK